MNKTIITIVIIAIIVLGGYLLLKNSNAPTLNPNLSSQETPTAPAPTAPESKSAGKEDTQQKEYVIRYIDSGYAPSTLTVETGGTVIFKNESLKTMWTASGIHPTHTLYNGTSLSEHCPDPANTAFDACAGVQPGNAWQFTFMKKGAWKYHNHLAPENSGTIIVK